MNGPGRRFDPAELRTSGRPGETQPTDAELAEALGVARELEALGAVEGIRPTEGFEDRVMAAIAAEPAPRLAVRPAATVRGGWAASFVLAIRDAWGVAMSGGRPMAVRAQALAFVLLVVVAAGALTTATAVTVGSFLQRNDGSSPTIEPAPTRTPAPTEQSTPSESQAPQATPSPGPSETPEATETAEPTEAVDAAETKDPDGTPPSTMTPRTTETPEPDDTHEPDDSPSPDGTDDHSGSGDGGSGHG